LHHCHLYKPGENTQNLHPENTTCTAHKDDVPLPTEDTFEIWNQDGARMCFQNDGKKWKNAQKYDSDLVELAG